MGSLKSSALLCPKSNLAHERKREEFHVRSTLKQQQNNTKQQQKQSKQQPELQTQQTQQNDQPKTNKQPETLNPKIM